MVTLVSFVVILWTRLGLLDRAGHLVRDPRLHGLGGAPVRGRRHLADPPGGPAAGAAELHRSSASRRTSASGWCACARTRRASRCTAARPTSRAGCATCSGTSAQNWWAIMRRRKKLGALTAGYDQAATLFPFIVAAPRYFAKEIQLGGLMQISNALRPGAGRAVLVRRRVRETSPSWKATVDRLDHVPARARAGARGGRATTGSRCSRTGRGGRAART